MLHSDANARFFGNHRGKDLRQKLAWLICQSRRQDLIDTPPVHIDDLEPPTQQFYGLSGLREMMHLSDHESCDGFVIAVIRLGFIRPTLVLLPL